MRSFYMPKPNLRRILALGGTMLAIGGGTAGMAAQAANAALPPVVTFRDLATGSVLDSNPWGDVYTLPENGGSYQKWIPASA